MLCAEAQAHLVAHRDAFALRYHRWCLREIAQEVRDDFRLVRRIPWSGAFLFLDFAAECSADDIHALMSEGIKRFNPRGADLAGDPITETETAVRRRLLAYRQPEVVMAGQTVTSLRLSPRALAIRESERQGQTTTRIKKTILRQALRNALRPILGEPERAAGGLQYCLPVGPWCLFTSLDLAGHKQLKIGQWISARRKLDFCLTRLEPAISPLSWLGIHPETGFDLIQEADLEEVATAVAEMCAHFMAQVSALVDGLVHEIPEDIADGAESPLRRDIAGALGDL